MPEPEDTDQSLPAGEEEELSPEAAQVGAEISELRNKLLRLQADFDNYRKRIGRARAEAGDECRMETAGKLLPIHDNLSRALAHAQQTPEVMAFVSGFEMIRQQLFELLRQMGVEEIAARPGDPFDPNVHEASGMAPLGEDAQEGAVALELEKGYSFKGALLRPARVLVYGGQ